MDEWKLEIKKVNNGYILKGKFENSDIVTERVFEENYLDHPKLEAMKTILYEIMEYFGIYNSKHNTHDLKIEIKKKKIKISK
jgi:hypothetical protein